MASDNDVVEVPVDQPPPVETASAPQSSDIVEVPVDAQPDDPNSWAPGISKFKQEFSDLVGGMVKDVPKALSAAKDAMWSGVRDLPGIRDDMVLQDFLYSGEKSIDDLLSGAIWVGDKAWHGIGQGLSILDRMAGTGMTAVADPIFGSNVMEMAKRRDIEQKLSGSEDNPEARTFPVSLTQDLIQDPLQYFMETKGKALQKSDSAAVKRIGEAVEGFAGVTGIAAALIAGAKLDPVSALKFGRLTEAGMEAEKAGKLASGVARQIEAGERTAVNLKLPLLGEVTPLASVQRKIAPPVINKAVEGAIRLEATKLGQTMRHYTTDPGWGTIKADGENLIYGINGLKYNTGVMMRTADRHLSALGVNLKDSEQRHALYKFLDNPSTYPAHLNDVVPKEAAQRAYNFLNTELSKAAAEARQAGLDVPPFMPGSLGENLSERYIPRGSTLSNRQALIAKERFEDLAEAEQILSGSTKKVDTNFLEKRSKLNREAMNKQIFEKYGLENYFHDDPVLAYGQKIEDVKLATAQKKFVDRMVNQFPQNKNDWVKAQMAARETIKTSKGPIDPQLYRIAYANLDDLKKLDSGVAHKFSKLVNAPLDQVYMPAPVADFVEGIFKTAKRTRAEDALLAYNRAFKNSVFFNPGFHGRNWYESAIRADNAGLSAAETASGMRDVWFGPKAPVSKKFLDEYDALAGRQGMAQNAGEAEGLLSGIEQRRAQAEVLATKDMVQGDNPFSRLMDGLRHQAATMGQDGFLGTVKKAFSPAVLQDNPLYRFSMATNEYGEKGFRFAMYKKLRSEGYEPLDAMRKVGDQFLNYTLTRQSVKGAKTQMMVPFMNYAVKNAEQVTRMLAQNPKNFIMYGPGGTFERAISNWSGWDPSQDYKLKEMYGPWYGEHILSKILPGAEVLEKEKDFMKKALGRWLSYGQDEQEGYQVLLKLPSNYHGLRMLNPMSLDDNAGPLVKMGYALLNTDPFTGEQLSIPGSDVSATERLKAAGKELISPLGGMIPHNTLKAVQLELDAHFPQYKENFLNMGFDPDVADYLFGKTQDEKWRRKAMKSLDTMKLLWMGTVTKADMDVMMRIMADAKDTKEQITKFTGQIKSGKANMGPTLERIRGMRERLFKRMDHMYTLLDEYQVRSDAALEGTPPPGNLMLMPPDEVELLPETVPPLERPTKKSTEAQLLRETLDDGVYEVPVDKDPGTLKETGP